MDKRTKIQVKNAAIHVAKGTFLPVCAAVFTALAPITGTVRFVKYIKEKKDADIHVSNKEDVVRALQIYGQALAQPTLGVLKEMNNDVKESKKELRKYDDSVIAAAQAMKMKKAKDAQVQQQQARIAQANTPNALAKSGVQDLLNIIRTAPSISVENVANSVEEAKAKDAFVLLGSGYSNGAALGYLTIGDGIRLSKSAVWVDGKKILDIPELQRETVEKCYYQRVQELQEQQKEQEVQDAIKLMRLRANVSQK